LNAVAVVGRQMETTVSHLWSVTSTAITESGDGSRWAGGGEIGSSFK
jgi:hypothetical protein